MPQLSVPGKASLPENSDVVTGFLLRKTGQEKRFLQKIMDDVDSGLKKTKRRIKFVVGIIFTKKIRYLGKVKHWLEIPNTFWSC